MLDLSRMKVKLPLHDIASPVYLPFEETQDFAGTITEYGAGDGQYDDLENPRLSNTQLDASPGPPSQ